MLVNETLRLCLGFTPNYAPPLNESLKQTESALWMWVLRTEICSRATSECALRGDLRVVQTFKGLTYYNIEHYGILYLEKDINFNTNSNGEN